jgi:molecular chaperone GrpE
VNDEPEVTLQPDEITTEEDAETPSSEPELTTESQNGEERGEDEEGELSLEEQLAEAEAKAAEYLEGWQRARAEFSNARKRLDRERAEARHSATVQMTSKLLPVLDDFELALENVPDEIAKHDWFEGVALIHRKLRSILEGAGIERIEAVGEPFDPNYHEAVLQEQSDEYESGIVIRELQPGYRLEDRIIRPAMVVVAA